MTRWTSAKMAAQQTGKPKPESANRITANIIRAINFQPRCAAYRINNVGVWDAEKQIHRKGATQKGLADIAAIINGRAVWIEVKAGRDRQSRDQAIFQQEVERAGGVYYIARSTSEFLEWFTKQLSK